MHLKFEACGLNFAVCGFDVVDVVVVAAIVIVVVVVVVVVVVCCCGNCV